LVKAYRDRMKGGFRLIPPAEVRSGPVLDNIDRDAAVDLFKFPVPMIHAKDGGRYIGTYCVVIMRDPDIGWVNLGTYRVVAHDRNTAGIWISPGKHAGIRENTCQPSRAVCCGPDPVLFAGSHEIPPASSNTPMPAAIAVALTRHRERAARPADARLSRSR
jgi:4-hydroxy-3-polyprenylbenzoate decarboxylase